MGDGNFVFLCLEEAGNGEQRYFYCAGTLRYSSLSTLVEPLRLDAFEVAQVVRLDTVCHCSQLRPRFLLCTETQYVVCQVRNVWRIGQVLFRFLRIRKSIDDVELEPVEARHHIICVQQNEMLRQKQC